MKNKKTTSSNYLDFIPVPCESLQSRLDETGLVIILVENSGLFHRLAQKFLKKPPVTQIHLDKMGSFIWPLINGSNTIYEIAQRIEEHFGQEAEPLYHRLLQYIRTLESYGFICIKKNFA